MYIDINVQKENQPTGNLQLALLRELQSRVVCNPNILVCIHTYNFEFAQKLFMSVRICINHNANELYCVEGNDIVKVTEKFRAWLKKVTIWVPEYRRKVGCLLHEHMKEKCEELSFCGDVGCVRKKATTILNLTVNGNAWFFIAFVAY